MHRTTALVAVLASSVPVVASAQDFDAHGFQLAAHDGDLRDPLSVRRPGRLTAGDFFIAGVAEYANKPLVFAATDSDGVTARDAFVAGLGVMNLSLGGAVHERVRFDLNAPIYVFTSGSAVNGGAAFGDTRLTGTVLALSPDIDGEGAGLGLNAWIDLPSGAAAQFLGRGSVAGGVSASATAGVGRVTLTGDVGAQLNPAVDLENLAGSDALVAGLGIGVKASDAVGITGEVVTQPPFLASTVPGTAFPAEGILSLRTRTASGGFVTAGAASGITRGAGVPIWRVFVGGGFGRIQGEKPEPVVETCPDGSLPAEGRTLLDGCLNPLTLAAERDGVPVKASVVVVGPDGETTRDIAPTGFVTQALPGSEFVLQATGEGCLAGAASGVMGNGPTRIAVPLAPVRPATLTVKVVDQDGAPIDGASITFDGGPVACGPDNGAAAAGVLTSPVGAGDYKLIVRAPSFATYLGDHTIPPDATEHEIVIALQTTLVEVTEEQIVILDKVYFETAKAIIKPDSFQLLNEIATTIKTHDSIGTVEIAGHTDSRGSESMNQELSQKRAEAVRDYLVGQGVSADQLLAKGYGESTPIATNDTAAGREQNRRVEFNLVDSDTDTEEGGQ